MHHQNVGNFSFFRIVIDKDHVDITKLNPDKIALSSTHNCLEFFLVSISRNFDLNPKKAAALMSHNNTYLTQVIIKGLKGNFDPIINWY